MLYIQYLWKDNLYSSIYISLGSCKLVVFEVIMAIMFIEPFQGKMAWKWAPTYNKPCGKNMFSKKTLFE